MFCFLGVFFSSHFYKHRFPLCCLTWYFGWQSVKSIQLLGDDALLEIDPRVQAGDHSRN